MQSLAYASSDEAATERLGRLLAAHLPDGTSVALDGPLGAGKTRIVQAVAEACGVDRRDVVSPTFVLVHHYHGRRTIHHLDAYRLPSGAEFLDLGVDELFAGDDLVFVEWADRVADCLPKERIDIRIDVPAPTQRQFTITARGASMQRVLDALRREM